MTIDGPAASGKSTVARLLAAKIGGQYLDTGAMYRAVAWAVLQAGIEVNNIPAILELIDKANFRFIPTPDGMAVYAGDVEITAQIRDPRLADMVRAVADAQPVRQRLVQMQRRFAEEVSILVTEGRDQGTVAFPYADAKFYLVADITERAKRRQAQLAALGINCTLEQVEGSIRQRDHADHTRQLGGLKPAADAIMVDTTNMSVGEVVSRLSDLLRQQGRLAGLGEQ